MIAPRAFLDALGAGRRRWLTWFLAAGVGATLLVCLLRLNDRSWSLVSNTLLLAAATSAISLPIGTILAWLVVRTDMPGRTTALVVFGVLLLVPLYLQAAGWQAGFGVQGWLTVGFAAPVLLQGWAGAIWIHALAAISWVVLIVGSGLRLVEPDLEEQALLDASPLEVLLRVTARGALGAIGVAALWVLITTAGEMTVTDLFAVRTYAEEIYTTMAIGPDLESPPLAALPGVVLVGWIVVAGLVLAARLAPHDRPLRLRPARVFALGRWRLPIAALVGLLLVLVVGVPLGNLCYQAGIVVAPGGAEKLRTWSPLKCLAMVAGSPLRYRREFGWSLTVGILAATGSVAIGSVLAWFARRGPARMALLLVVAAVCLSLPGPVIGLGVIHLLNWSHARPMVYLYDQTIFAPWLALVIRGLGPATLILWHALRTIPPEMLDAAAVDGAGRWSRFWRIGLASRLPAVGLAWLVVLALALGDLAATVLVVPPGMRTLSWRIFDLLHSGVQDRVAGICLALVLAFAAVAAAAAALIRRWRP
jgi:iron(III) transport system permease protein